MYHSNWLFFANNLSYYCKKKRVSFNAVLIIKKDTMNSEKNEDSNVNGTNSTRNGLDYTEKSKDNPLDA